MRTARAFPLDEHTYWNIVARSLVNATDQQSQLVNLVSILQEYSTDAICQFDLRTEELLFKAHTDNLWCAATIMNKRFVSDDNFMNFKTWLISRGKDVYYDALSKPDSLTKEVKTKGELYGFEEFRYAPEYAFKLKTGVEFPFGYPKDFPYSQNKYPQLEFAWQTGNRNDMRSICPQLFDLMYKKKRLIAPVKKTQKKRK
ncbi:DUF4240 domain-containing protein [Chitinophaga filiformis]|uniref:DUF4240 domain-containing protein n=1 Tax=Chitinophaga filiformis TaxID=104663 RepID=A0ABY4HWK5_CHIFI|nr:DUF4240 domain-containing protein [Chitinophaga filiformis]UPK67967.1 DUF4240 domain-containing protein [Chitinophaga filiformis]